MIIYRVRVQSVYIHLEFLLIFYQFLWEKKKQPYIFNLLNIPTSICIYLYLTLCLPFLIFIISVSLKLFFIAFHIVFFGIYILYLLFDEYSPVHTLSQYKKFGWFILFFGIRIIEKINHSFRKNSVKTNHIHFTLPEYTMRKTLFYDTHTKWNVKIDIDIFNKTALNRDIKTQKKNKQTNKWWLINVKKIWNWQYMFTTAILATLQAVDSSKVNLNKPKKKTKQIKKKKFKRTKAKTKHRIKKIDSSERATIENREFRETKAKERQNNMNEWCSNSMNNGIAARILINDRIMTYELIAALSWKLTWRIHGVWKSCSLWLILSYSM